MTKHELMGAIYRDDTLDDYLVWNDNSTQSQYYSYESKTIDPLLDIIKREYTSCDNRTKENANKTKESSTMKNVLFLAPGYAYAKSVISNQSKELDLKKIPYNASTDYNNLYIQTDNVRVEMIYTDPIKYVPNLFKNRDAVFGKKELLDKAVNTFYTIRIPRANMSLSAYIAKAHAQDKVEPEKTVETYIPEIKNVYFNNPMTVVMWEDGTKTMIRCQEGDVYSPESGLALCIAKKSLGNMPNFNNVFKKWIPEEKEIKDE